MTTDGERWIGPGDTARRFGLTTKALRVYEREGLLKPARTAAGWRVYGPEHFVRLHLIVVLRDLGLPLKAVRTLLYRKTPSLVALLTVQQEALEAKRTRIDRAISLLTAARGDLSSGRALSLDDLTHLSRETVMSEDLFDSEADPRVKTLIDEHLGTETRATLKARVEERIRSIGKSKETYLGSSVFCLPKGARPWRRATPIPNP
jgi:DNA-binding transcriptional MerR regulator